jgi:hypothetical protein
MNEIFEIEMEEIIKDEIVKNSLLSKVANSLIASSEGFCSDLNMLVGYIKDIFSDENVVIPTTEKIALEVWEMWFYWQEPIE